MRKILITWLAICGVLLGAWQASANMLSPIVMFGKPRAAGCSQATALKARMDGSENAAAVTTAVCGMVTDGVWATLDALWVPAINSNANALLNWVSSSFPAVKQGTVTFTTNAGWTGDGSTGYYTTGYNPTSAGGNFTQNSAHVTACVLTSRTTSHAYGAIGGSTGFNTGPAVSIDPPDAKCEFL